MTALATFAPLPERAPAIEAWCNWQHTPEAPRTPAGNDIAHDRPHGLFLLR